MKCGRPLGQTSVRPHHLEKIRELRVSGVTWAAIAEQFPYSASTIQRKYHAKYGKDQKHDCLGHKITVAISSEHVKHVAPRGGTSYIRALIDADMGKVRRG